MERVAAAVSQGILADCNLAEAQELQMHAMQKVSVQERIWSQGFCLISCHVLAAGNL